MSNEPIAAPVATDGGPSHDTLLAARNAIKLGLSLMGTWGISLGVMFLLPRFLGPEGLGPVRFAETFAGTVLTALSFGVDIYIRKEIPVRPKHASDFFGAVMVLRLGSSLLLMAGMAVFLHLTHQPPELHSLVYVYAAAQVLHIFGESFKALLQSHGTVNELSVLNIAGKLLWGVGTLIAVWPLGGVLIGIGVALLVSKVVEVAVLMVLARKHLALQFHWAGWSTLKVVVAGSVAYYVNDIARAVYNTGDLTVLKLLSNNVEAGFYGAVSGFARLGLMIAPMIGWVIMPLLARAHSRSQQEYTQLVRRVMELTLVFSIPLALGMALGAPELTLLATGAKFAPAAPALKLLAPTYTFIYVSTICGISLAINNRPWTLTGISLFGMVLNPVLNVVLVPVVWKWWGLGGGALASAMAQVITEGTIMTLMLWQMGKMAFDARSVVMAVKSVLVCAVVVAVDWLAVDYGWARLVLDGFVYVVLILAVRAVPLRETYTFARQVFRSKGKDAAEDGLTRA